MRNNGHRKITELLALLVFGVFALCVAAVLLTGAKTYSNLTERGNLVYERRVASRYLTTRFHQAEAVLVEDFYGCSALAIREEIDGKGYLTRVYCYEGTVRELFAAENTAVTPGDGEIVMEAKGLAFSLEEQLLAAQITYADGSVETLWLSLPEWKEGAA